MSKHQFFANVSKIQYNPKAERTDALLFRHYNSEELVLGRPMREWLRFSVCFWHTFCWEGTDPFGSVTFQRAWLQHDDPMERAKAKVRAGFEFLSKLGVPYCTFHDRDIAPEGATLTETNRNLDEIVDLVEELMKETGIKLLWGTANLFSNIRYMNGAATNPDVHSFAYAGAQVKKMLEITKRLGGEGFVFWGGRDGYQSLLNTDFKKETDHLAAFLRMAVEYAEQIGFKGQFLIEPKPKEPTKHQYDYDSQTVIGFLKTHNLDKHFKLNIEPNHTTLAGHCFEHDFHVASKLGFLGSMDINTGDQSVGWDTDQFLMDPKLATFLALTMINQNGIAPGGLNFDCKIRRESSDLEDLFIAHIGAMDTLAFGLKKAAQIYEDKVLANMVNQRYMSFQTTELGKAIESGKATLADCDKFIQVNGEPKHQSAKQEKFETVFNSYFLQ